MKQYLLFAGREGTDLKGVQGLVGDFDSFAEAFVSLVDQQTPAQWWHILDTVTGEVVERRHLKIHTGLIGFERSQWVVGQPADVEPKVAPAPATATPEATSVSKAAVEEPKTVPDTAAVPPIAIGLPKAADLSTLEQDLRSVVTSSLKSGHTNGKANGHVNGASAEH